MEQLPLPLNSIDSAEVIPTERNVNRLTEQDKAFHDWYRFVLSYPAHLVRDYLKDFGLDSTSTVLDPFCGTGTTVVESKLNGIPCIGIEANPVAHFASSVKIKWDTDLRELQQLAQRVADEAVKILQQQGISDAVPFYGNVDDLPLRTLDPDTEKLLIKNSISPLPLHKTLILLEVLNQYKDSDSYEHALLALAKALVFCISNVRFGPEIGVGKPKLDAPVVTAWLSEVMQVVKDLESVANRVFPECRVYHADSRDVASIIKPHSIDAIITSPPYPNEKDYTRTTRLESVLLGFINNKSELRAFKKGLLRSNTRGVYKDDDDDRWIADSTKINEIADRIEQRRIELNKTSGFEKLYGRVTKLYFGGMARHLAELRSVLKPGAQLAYVVGDQASYLRIMIRTGQLLGEIAEELGYKVERIDLFRTRAATATKKELREEVVVLRWLG